MSGSSITARLAAAMLILCFEVCGAHAAPTGGTGLLNDTGITRCWNSKFEQGECSRDHAGAWLEFDQDGRTGQDALAASGKLKKRGRGAAGFDFTKIGADGQKLPHDAASWSCVLDNRTGLMWEEHTQEGGLLGMDRGFEWFNSDDAANGGFAGYNKHGASTESLVNAVNEEGLCGHQDWRMPGRMELISLVDFSKRRSEPAIDLGFFPHTQASGYWSSAAYAGKKELAWYVDFGETGGDSNAARKDNRMCVRLVRVGI